MEKVAHSVIGTARGSLSSDEDRSEGKTSFSAEEQKKDPARRIMFKLGEISLESPHEEQEEVDDCSGPLPGQKEMDGYSVGFARIQQSLKNQIKAVANSNPEISAKKRTLQEELNSLRQADDESEHSENLQRREEICQELKRLKSIPEKDPAKLVQLAHFHEEAYVRTWDQAQQMLRWLKENPECQNELSLTANTESY